MQLEALTAAAPEMKKMMMKADQGKLNIEAEAEKVNNELKQANQKNEDVKKQLDELKKQIATLEANN